MRVFFSTKFTRYYTYLYLSMNLECPELLIFIIYNLQGLEPFWFLRFRLSLFFSNSLHKIVVSVSVRNLLKPSKILLRRWPPPPPTVWKSYEIRRAAADDLSRGRACARWRRRMFVSRSSVSVLQMVRRPFGVYHVARRERARELSERERWRGASARAASESEYADDSLRRRRRQPTRRPRGSRSRLRRGVLTPGRRRRRRCDAGAHIVFPRAARYNSPRRSPHVLSRRWS